MRIARLEKDPTGKCKTTSNGLLIRLFMFLSLFCLVPFVTRGELPEIDPPPFLKGEFKGTRRIVFRILENFPPDQYFYVGLGRSLTAEVALFETLAKYSEIQGGGIEIMARNAPVSLSIREVYSRDEDGRQMIQRAKSHPKLSDTALENVKQWLLSVVDDCAQHRRKALFMDYINSGFGIDQIIQLLEGSEQSSSIEFLLLKDSSAAHVLRGLKKSNVTIWDIDGPLKVALDQNARKLWSEYPKWLPEERSQPNLARLKEYDLLKQYIEARLQQENNAGNQIRKLFRKRACAKNFEAAASVR